MRSEALVSVLAMVLVAGCNRHDDTVTTNTVMADNGVLVSDTVVPPNDSAETALANGTGEVLGDPGFVNAAATSDVFEIESSRVVASKSTNADIKAFAAMLIKDHTASTEALKAAATKANPVVTPVAELDPGMQSKVDALKAADVKSIDALYLQQQVAAHETALSLLKDYAKNGATQSLRDFATKTQVPVTAHLEKARTLKP